MNKKLKNWLGDDSSGEVMVETTLIMTITLFLLVALISLGFLFYQRALVITIANETATEIASNYKLVAEKEKDGEYRLKLFRTTFSLNYMESESKTKAQNYAKYRAPLSTLGTDNQLSVDSFDIFVDNIGRLHAEVTISMKCDFLFSGALRYFGVIDDSLRLSATGRAECLDITAYAGHLQFMRYIGDKVAEMDKNGILDQIAKIVQNIRDIKNMF